MASGTYDRFRANLMNKVVDLEADTINVALLDSSHSFSTGDNTWADVVTNEISGTGYTASGSALSGKAVTQAATTKWDATDATWTTATFTAAHAVIWDETAANNLICSIDFGGNQSVSAGTFTIQWHADGIITLA